jgi:hypothetical protein
MSENSELRLQNAPSKTTAGKFAGITEPLILDAVISDDDAVGATQFQCQDQVILDR